MPDQTPDTHAGATPPSGPAADPAAEWAELLRLARIAIAEQDADLRYTAVFEESGVFSDPVSVIGRREEEVTPAEILDQVVALKRKAIETGRSQQGRLSLHVHGQLHAFELTVTPRRDAEGRTVGLLSLSVDLTELVRTRDQIRANEARLAGIVGSAMDAIISVGPDQRILYFNPAAERMFGVAADDAVGTEIARFVPESVRERHATHLRRFGETGDTARRMGGLGQLFAVRASGEEFPIEASISHAGRGADQLFTVIIRDRTEQNQLHAQLLQSQKLEGIGRLAGGVAHDFNNLLTVILGYCELLRMRQRGGVELEEINNAARRASQLTRQLLAFSRRQVLQVETLDLNGLVRGLHRMLRRIIGEDVELQLDLGDEPMWVVADVGQMEQVVLNLVVNARDAMPSGGRLRIATRIADHAPSAGGSAASPSVELAVRDSGVGMSDEVRARIFEPFFTTKGDAGTGLGLATVYGVVVQTGGDVTCESAPGAGTTFRVWLPLASPPREEAEEVSPAQPARGHETVLLVEDEALVRELAARALREHGYTVLEAQGVDDALRYLEHPALALVVSDVVMAGRSGSDLRAEAALRRPGLEVLLMTGYSEALVTQPVDAAHLLRKPFTPTDLLAKVRHLLDGRPG